MGLGQLTFSASGRVSRKTYWLSIVGFTFASAVLSGAALLVADTTATDDGQMSLSTGTVSTLTLLILFGAYFVLAFSGLLISIKRCHDRGRSGWFLLAEFIPVVGPIWVLVELGFLPGTVGTNRFGTDPTRTIILAGYPA